MLVTPDVLANSSARLPDDADPQETAEWLEAMEAVLKHRRAGAGQVPARNAHRRRRPVRREDARRRHHAVRQHDPRRRPARVPRRPRPRTEDQEHRPLERDGDGAEGEQEHERRRAHQPPSPAPPPCTKSASTTSSAAARPTTPATWSSSRVTPAPACTPGRSSKAGSTRQQLNNFRQELQPGGGLQQLPAPVADAGLLAVPDRQHGPRPDHVDLPRPLQPLPPRPRPRQDRRRPRLGVPRRRRVRRAGNRSAASASPAARSSTTSPGSSTATCSGSTARSAATARSFRNSKASSAGPAGTSSRSIWGSDWDELLKQRPHRRARPPHDGSGGRRVPRLRRPRHADRRRGEVEQAHQRRRGRGPARRVHPRHFFNTPELKALVEHLSNRQIAALKRGGHDPLKVYAAYKAAIDAQGPADRHPGEDGQGLRHPRRRRRRGSSPRTS